MTAILALWAIVGTSFAEDFAPPKEEAFVIRLANLILKSGGAVMTLP